uniref:Uncharacterized protein n=1 Tax=Meloidogyne enterolobii TaxID=390850 RepID=A0A6V7XCA3_MELEN|nr:unnamed protein product [Meloidogyne enterolobii]
MIKQILADGNRHEYYGLELEEIYLASGEAYRSSASKKWRQEKFSPNLDKMSERQDGSYSALDKRAIKTSSFKYFFYFKKGRDKNTHVPVLK